MTVSRSRIKNVVFFIILGLFILPQTRLPLQVFIHKGLALFSPSKIDPADQVEIQDYNWVLAKQDGTVFNFESTKGKVVLVNFWATWCPPCIAEMPSLELLYKHYQDDIEFVFVSNEAVSVINAFKAKNGYTFDVFKPISKYPKAFNVTSIPRTFLIDKKGRIVMDKTGASNWNSDAVRATIEKLRL